MKTIVYKVFTAIGKIRKRCSVIKQPLKGKKPFCFPRPEISCPSPFLGAQPERRNPERELHT